MTGQRVTNPTSCLDSKLFTPFYIISNIFVEMMNAGLFACSYSNLLIIHIHTLGLLCFVNEFAFESKKTSTHTYLVLIDVAGRFSLLVPVLLVWH